MKIHTQRHFVPELLMVLVCLAGAAGFLARPSGGAAVSLELKSPDFTAGGNIPKQFTCEGANISPALTMERPACCHSEFRFDRRRSRRSGGNLGALGDL